MNIIRLSSTEVNLWNIKYTVNMYIGKGQIYNSYQAAIENQEPEFPGKWAKNQNRENREMENETAFGNIAGIFPVR